MLLYVFCVLVAMIVCFFVECAFVSFVCDLLCDVVRFVLGVFPLHLLVRFVCDLLCEVVCGVCDRVCGSFI